MCIYIYIERDIERGIHARSSRPRLPEAEGQQGAELDDGVLEDAGLLGAACGIALHCIVGICRCPLFRGPLMRSLATLI